jgi:DNA-binding transcriptional LysR family regulator
MIPMVDLDKLRTFYIATKTRKFNTAAEELGMDSSAVTRQVQALERDLGCILFERGGFRGLTLTEHGKALQSLTHKLFTQVAEIGPILSQVNNTFSGPLKIWVHSGYSLTFVSSYINEFMEKYPDISIELIASPNIMDVAIREADIAISPNIENNGDLIEKKLFTYTLKLYASKKYLEAYGTPEKVEDLENHRFISTINTSLIASSTANWYLNLIPGMILEPYFISNSSLAINKLIETGMGIGSCAPQFVDKSLVQILPHITGPELSVAMVYGEHFKNSRKVNALYNFLAEKTK